MSYAYSLLSAPTLSGLSFVTVDTISSETSSATITTDPVEFGANVTDSAFINPSTITITGVLSPFTSLLVPIYDPEQPGLEYQYLKQLQISRQPLALSTPFYLYQNVLIQNIQIDRNSAQGLQGNIVITLQEVLIENAIGQSVGTNPSSPEYGQAINGGFKQPQTS